MKKDNVSEMVDELASALSAAGVELPTGELQGGAPLKIEPLDLAKRCGLYRESEIDPNDPDYIPFSEKWVDRGERLYYKKSEGKVKTFKDANLKLKPWKDLVKDE